MANALYFWDREFGTGGNLGDQYYMDMAWSGLLETKAFAKQYASPTYAEQEKNRIKTTIINFEKSGTNECNTN
jgi:hypothetical protein